VEAEALVAKGARELILVAQDTASYGKDIPGDGVTLATLLRRLSQIDSVEWLRLLYAYPENITDELIAEMATNSKVLNYIDIPMQHADDEILRAMGRRSSRAALSQIVESLRRVMPDICIRTTFIVGFPGETLEQFDNLMNFAQEISFDKLGVFTYSQEDGTPAAKMPGQLEASLKDERKARLVGLQQEISRRKLAEKVGNTCKTIVEGNTTEGRYVGRTYLDAPGVDGTLVFKSTQELALGDIVDVRITQSSDYDLEGVMEG